VDNQGGTSDLEKRGPQIELSPAEINIVESAMQEDLPRLLKKASHFIGRLEKTGRFDELTEKMASQEGWDGKGYGGNSLLINKGFSGEESVSLLPFAGGFEESVLPNLLYSLGLSYSKDRGGRGETPDTARMLSCFLLKRAMEQNPKLKQFVTAVVSATKKVADAGFKKRHPEYEGSLDGEIMEKLLLE